LRASPNSRQIGISVIPRVAVAIFAKRRFGACGEERVLLTSFDHLVGRLPLSFTGEGY
jgi:hypothetical protein